MAGKNRKTPDDVLAEDEIRLAHFSVKEYLKSDVIKTTGIAHFHIQEKLTNTYQARACLVYLVWVQEHRLKVTEEMVDGNFHFATYSAQYWSVHARRAGLDVSYDIKRLGDEVIKTVLQSEEARYSWISLFDPDLAKPRYDVAPAEVLSPLYYAAKLGLSQHVQKFISGGATVEEPDESKPRPLHAACAHGFVPTVRILLENGATFPGDGDDEIWEASAASGDINLIKLLLAKERETDDRPRSYTGAIIPACYGGFMDIVRLLLIDTPGTDVNTEFPHGGGRANRLLQAASRSGHDHMAKLFLARGAELDAQGGHYGTALRAAALEGHEPVVKTLLAEGADPHFRGGCPCSALVAAMSFNRTSIFDLLLEYPKTDVNNNEGMCGTALQEAASEGRLDSVRKLLENGAEVNAEGGTHHTALQAACSEGFKDVVELLLQHGALPDVPEVGPSDVLCLTAKGEAVPQIIYVPYRRAGISDREEWLNQKFVRLSYNTKDEDWESLMRNRPWCTIQKGKFGSSLRAVVAGGHMDIVQLLLDRGARTDVRGGAVGSTFWIARCIANPEMERTLLDGGATDTDDQEANHIGYGLVHKLNTNRVRLTKDRSSTQVEK